MDTRLSTLFSIPTTGISPIRIGIREMPSYTIC